MSEHVERLVQLIKGDEPSKPLPEGGDIAALEIDEKDMDVNKPSYFAPVTGAGAALAQAANQSQGVKVEQKQVVVDEEDDEDDRIEEV